jgi:hypothetical protein
MLSAVAALALAALPALAAVPADKIAALPGWNQALPSAQYSGLVKCVSQLGVGWGGGRNGLCCHGCPLQGARGGSTPTPDPEPQ